MANDYYDDLYFPARGNYITREEDEDDLVGCENCGLSCVKGEHPDRPGYLILLDPTTRAPHACMSGDEELLEGDDNDIVDYD